MFAALARVIDELGGQAEVGAILPCMNVGIFDDTSEFVNNELLGTIERDFKVPLQGSF